MKQGAINHSEITDYLQITPPFLMIDQVLKIIPGKSCHAIKRIRQDEWFFKAHLEREQLMPGVLQIEAMLQTLVMTIYTLDGHKGRLTYVTDINTKLISKVSPKTQLDIYADLLSYKRGIAKGEVKAHVNNVKVCQGEFQLVTPDLLPHVKINQ